MTIMSVAGNSITDPPGGVRPNRKERRRLAARTGRPPARTCVCCRPGGTTDDPTDAPSGNIFG
jgi:hypothetical protein